MKTRRIFTDGSNWIQVDLRKKTRIVGIAVQGSAKHDEYVTRFKVKYGDAANSLDYIKDETGNVVVSKSRY